MGYTLVMEMPVDRYRRYTVEEYFQIDAASEERYEYMDGYIFPVGEPLAMSGGSMYHSFIACNVARLIGNALTNTPCRVFNADLRVRLGRKLRYAYPDVGIVCGKPEMVEAPTTGYTLLHPRVIIEILSPSTESRDRSIKFDGYRELESLEEYILVAQNEARIESYLRQSDGTWSFMPVAELTAVAQVRCLGINLALNDVYADVEFPALVPPDDQKLERLDAPES